LFATLIKKAKPGTIIPKIYPLGHSKMCHSRTYCNIPKIYQRDPKGLICRISDQKYEGEREGGRERESDLYW